MAKLTKQEIKLHEQALRLLEKDVLTYDDKHFVLDNWHEGAKHVNSMAGAFFTPASVAGGLAIEAQGSKYRKYIDLCAGIGRLAFTVWNHTNPFHDDRKPFEFTCVEINPDYIEVGKKIMPSARWIQADVLTLPADVGHFDCAIGNPPFGVQVGSRQPSPRLKSGPFEYKVIDVASDIADDGVFIIPQSSAPFQISGRRCTTFDKSRGYKKFEDETGIVLEPNCGIDCAVDANWRGVRIVAEIATADFTEARERRNDLTELDDIEPSLILASPDQPSQGELFPIAA